MNTKEHDLQQLCEKVYKEQDAERRAVLVDQLHAALDERANRIRSSTQMTLLRGRSAADSPTYATSLAQYRVESLAPEKAESAIGLRKPVALQDVKLEQTVSRASAIICVLLHCFLPLRFLFRRSKTSDLTTPVDPLPALASASKHFSATTRS